MHPVVTESLEEYLAGVLEPVIERQIEAHLSTCAACREEVRAMREISNCFEALRSDEVLVPTPWFQARVMEHVGTQAAAPTFSGFFALNLAFGRRLVFTSLLMLAVLGSYFVSRETSYPSDASPDAVMAEQELPTFDSVPAPQNMLVTLTSYEH